MKSKTEIRKIKTGATGFEKAYSDALELAQYYRWKVKTKSHLAGNDPLSGHTYTAANFWEPHRMAAIQAHKALAKFWMEKAVELRKKHNIKSR